MSYGDGGFWFTQPVSTGGYGAPMLNSYRTPMVIGFNGDVHGYAGASTGSFATAVYNMMTAKYLYDEAKSVGAPTGVTATTYNASKNVVNLLRKQLLSGKSNAYAVALAAYENELQAAGKYAAILKLTMGPPAKARYAALHNLFTNMMWKEKIGSTTRRKYEQVANTFARLSAHAMSTSPAQMSNLYTQALSKLAVLSRSLSDASASGPSSLVLSPSQAGFTPGGKGSRGGSKISGGLTGGGLLLGKTASGSSSTSSSAPGVFVPTVTTAVPPASVMGPVNIPTPEQASSTADAASTATTAVATVDAATADATASATGIRGFVGTPVGKVVAVASLAGIAYLVWENRKAIQRSMS